VERIWNVASALRNATRAGMLRLCWKLDLRAETLPPPKQAPRTVSGEWTSRGGFIYR
jgi:hypothetical protein